jgi:biopolymer transport protein ExbD
MKIRKSRTYKRGRIEIIPMIDVMFFLLATFMLASLSMQNLHSLPVNLPQGHASPIQSKTPITLTITQDKLIYLDKTQVTLNSLASTLKAMLPSPDASIIVAADSNAPNGITVQAMLKAREAGAQHFLIAVKHVD